MMIDHAFLLWQS